MIVRLVYLWGIELCFVTGYLYLLHYLLVEKVDKWRYFSIRIATASWGICDYVCMLVIVR